MKTNLPEFLEGLDAGIVEERLAALLSDVSLGVTSIEGKKDGEIVLKLKVSKVGDDQVMIAHTITHKIPNAKGSKSEERSGQTPFYVNAGGGLTLIRKNQGELEFPENSNIAKIEPKKFNVK